MIAVAVALQLAGSQPECERAATQPDLNDCALAEYHRADEALNRQWRLTLATARRWDRDSSPSRASSTYESRLRAAQRAWLAFRDAECDAEYHGEIGAQIAYTMNIHCHTDMTVERTAELAEIAGRGPL
jgi:uncharacterized protein YecT (DUF1311 family)